MATKIFVRERRKIEKGEKKTRFQVVGISGSDVKIYSKYIRKNEIEQIDKETNAEVIYLQSAKGRKPGGGKKA